jgi:hypothetical protein
MLCNALAHFAQWFSEASNSITAIAAIAAAAFAYIGLQTWRHQLKGASEYALAKELLKAAYRVREAFKHVRNPAMFSYEYPEGMRQPDGHLAEDKRADGIGHAYEERFKVLSEAFLTLEDKNLDGQVEWGSKYSEIIVPLRKCRIELKIALQDHIESLRRTYERPASTVEERREAGSVMYYLGEAPSEHDLFTPQINAAISEFESRLRPIIGKRNG